MSDIDPAAAVPDDLAERVTRWIDADPDTGTAGELSDLLGTARSGDRAAITDLADRFSGPLVFGTAGLRGAIGAGESRMNRAVVIRAAAGLVSYLASRLDGEAPVVVIGFDARHGSAQFARDTAAVVTAAGGRALLFDAIRPTPVLAFAVRHLGADAGVMVTASHNPPRDNGYKVYLGGRVFTGAGQGAQLVSPADAEIAEHIAAASPAREVPRADDGWELVGKEIERSYLDRVATLVPRGRRSSLRIVTTSLHGVGGATLAAALGEAGFADVHAVPEQALPDPDFPTVSFPNPEEPGALDLALDLAARVRADLLIANDPDADRCSVAVPSGGTWRQLTGDEVGALLGQQAATVAARSGGVLANSIVSSRLLARIAAVHGVDHRQTLTGFKWISRVPGLVFGYEEALGYCVDPSAVRDKDGISAAVLVAHLADRLAASGDTLVDLLDDLAVRHGLHATAQWSVRVSDLGLIAEAMRTLRRDGLTSLAGAPVVSVTDLTQGSEDLPPTDGLVFLTATGDRAIVRPSGTEPKLKAYLDVVIEAPDRASLPSAREQAAARLAGIQADLQAATGL